MATNEASDGVRARVLPGEPWLTTADSFRLESLGWAGAAPNPQTGSSDGDTAIELLSVVVT